MRKEGLKQVPLQRMCTKAESSFSSDRPTGWLYNADKDGRCGTYTNTLNSSWTVKVSAVCCFFVLF